MAILTADKVAEFFEHGCKIWPHLTAVLVLSDRDSDFI